MWEIDPRKSSHRPSFFYRGGYVMAIRKGISENETVIITALNRDEGTLQKKMREAN